MGGDCVSILILIKTNSIHSTLIHIILGVEGVFTTLGLLDFTDLGLTVFSFPLLLLVSNFSSASSYWR